MEKVKSGYLLKTRKTKRSTLARERKSLDKQKKHGCGDRQKEKYDRALQCPKGAIGSAGKFFKLWKILR